VKNAVAAAVVLLCCAVVAGQQASTGHVRGTIRYTGALPPDRRITLTDGQVIVHNDVVVEAKTKGLRDVAVILDWKEKVPADAQAKPVVVDQRDMLFQPRVVTVQEGRKVRFENNDLYNHAVSAQSVHAENVFNVTTPAGQPYEHKFKWQKNPIPIGCVLHSWMRAYVIVAQHPYHAVSDVHGVFRIDDIPAGKHSLMLVHPDTNHRAKVEVEVQAGKTAEVTVEWKELKK
jgi:plastocyanin